MKNLFRLVADDSDLFDDVSTGALLMSSAGTPSGGTGRDL